MLKADPTAPWEQVVVVPLRVNVNLKALTVEDLVERRKVVTIYACALSAASASLALQRLLLLTPFWLAQRLHLAMVKHTRSVARTPLDQ